MIVPIVEGHAEREAIPLFLRRVLSDEGIFDLPVRQGIRVPRDQLVKQHELEKKIEFARRQPGSEGICIVIDADDDCPRELAGELLSRGSPVAASSPLAIVLANIELEAWFIAGVVSLRGVGGIRNDAVPPTEPETIRDAKGWLTRHMLPGRTYIPVDNQATFAARFDYRMASERSRSLRKLLSDIRKMGAQLRPKA